MVHDAWIELLNSSWHNRLGTAEQTGRLVDRTWLESYVKRWGLDLTGVPRERIRRSFYDFRNALRVIIDLTLARKR
jgi:hypothetical protein